MNRFSGHITKIETEEQMTLLEVLANGLQFTGVLMETPQKQIFEIGQGIGVLFNPTELFLARNLTGMISIRNRFTGIITDVQHGKLLTKVTLKSGEASLVSIITRTSAERLNCKIGEQIEALLKTNELLFDLNPENE